MVVSTTSKVSYSDEERALAQPEIQLSVKCMRFHIKVLGYMPGIANMHVYLTPGPPLPPAPHQVLLGVAPTGIKTKHVFKHSKGNVFILHY